MDYSILSVIGIVFSIAMMGILVYKGLNTGVATVISTCAVALCSGIPVATALTDYYVSGFAGAIQSFLFMFALGALFGGLMDRSGAADKFARCIMQYIHGKWSLYVCMIVNLLLVWGGVNCFIICFTVLPIYLSIFRELNIPRKLLPVSIWAGSAGFVSCSLPGVPSTINMIPAQILGTDLFAGLDICIVTSLASVAFIYFYFEYLLKKARRKQEGYVETEKDRKRMEEEQSRKTNTMPLPMAMTPMIFLFVTLNFLKWNLVYAMGASCILALVMFWNYIPDKINSISSGWSGVSVILSVGACMAFGAVIKNTVGFQMVLDWVLNFDINPLITLGISSNVLAAAMASGTGAVATATEMVGMRYVAMGVNPNLVHRIIAIASQGLDTLPHNGGVITYLGACDCSYKESYGPIFVISLLWPLVLTVIAIAMGMMFY